MNLDYNALYTKLRAQLASQIDPATAVLVGIHSGGFWIAEQLHRDLQIAAPLASLNIAFYRDDFDRIGLHPRVTPSSMPASVEEKTIVLVDDVLYTGRTIRAAMNELFDYGRPARVMLAVLIDRGGRELPIAADACAAKLELPEDKNIVLSKNTSGALALALEERGAR
jgi:pyrimidine operon attenuation protein / uracil phosphoribosyltransferase